MVSPDWLLLFCSLVDLFDASYTVVCLVCAGAAHLLLLGAVGWARVVSIHGQGGNTARAEVASVVLSSIVWNHCSWQLSTVTPQAALT